MDILDEKVTHEEVDHLHHVSKLPRVLVAIVLSLLVVSYTLVSFPLADIITGSLESQRILNSELDFGEFRVSFSPEALAALQQEYLRTQEVEFAACFGGTVEGDQYILESFELAQMQEQHFNRVVFSSCSEDSLAFIHSHPRNRCRASFQDHQTHRRLQEENPELLMMVICDVNTLSVYR